MRVGPPHTLCSAAALRPASLQRLVRGTGSSDLRHPPSVIHHPPSDFVIGTVELKSRATLHLAEKGRLLGSGSVEHYHAGNGVPPGNGNIVLLSAANAEHVAIEGRGTIDGSGAKFFTGRGDNTGPGQNSAQGYSQRPHLIVLYRCQDVLIRDVFLIASAYHCTRILNCERVNLDGVRIYNRVNKNNDAFHINSSRYVHVSNCDVACQDDACAPFGSNTFVTVTNCTFSTRWSVFRFGGGDPENVTVSKCVIYETYGCPIKMRFDGVTHAQNLSFSSAVTTTSKFGRIFRAATFAVDWRRGSPILTSHGSTVRMAHQNALF